MKTTLAGKLANHFNLQIFKSHQVMKTNFLKQTVAGILALSMAGSALAETIHINIVASNGDRQATQTAISNLLDNWTYQGTSGQATKADPGSLSKATGSNFGAWQGTYGGDTLIIKASYSGALAGVAAIAGNTFQRFVNSDGTGTASLKSPLDSSAVEGEDYVREKATIGFSTNFQSTSPFRGWYKGTYYNTVREEIVGVSPLGFYASPGFPGDNITTQLAQQLYLNGYVNVAQFTGDYAAHGRQVVYAIGRNTDAGQRFGAYLEIGLKFSQAVRVWKPVVEGAQKVGNYNIGGTVVSHTLWPEETVSDIYSPLGSGGYTGGAVLAEVLTVTLSEDAYKGKYTDADTGETNYLFPDATGGYYIGYLTPGDAGPRVLNHSVESARGVALKYNGVVLNDDNVKTGRYTAWLYNRLLRPTTGLTDKEAAFADAIRNRLRQSDAIAGGGLFDNESFKVQRYADGGLVQPKKFIEPPQE